MFVFLAFGWLKRGLITVDVVDRTRQSKLPDGGAKLHLRAERLRAVLLQTPEPAASTLLPVSSQGAPAGDISTIIPLLEPQVGEARMGTAPTPDCSPVVQPPGGADVPAMDAPLPLSLPPVPALATATVSVPPTAPPPRQPVDVDTMLGDLAAAMNAMILDDNRYDSTCGSASEWNTRRKETGGTREGGREMERWRQKERGGERDRQTDRQTEGGGPMH